MLGYWLAVVCRLVLPALAIGAVCAAAMTAVLVLGDGMPWSGAAPQALAAGAAVALAFTAALSISMVVSAARTARWYGLTLGPEAVALPSVREVRVPAIEGRTVFQLTDSVRYAVEKNPVLRLEEVTAFGHGTLDLTLHGPSDTTVSAQVSVTTGAKETAAVVKARPAAAYKRLDAAACWAVARSVEESVAQALRAEAAGGTAAR
ncbi:hypothetical protein E2C00_00050 [Streptomyces sp. WAC05374]|uniref:hypothetical protein n=1 Tax=Streptomyces sp. WAC05374 TaxID=2487420 RepID=UPI000F8632ED|nr:hypothetical protein [Streptomyces sp. WAC05374]RST19672.1 hypothetical protein EF905_00900 [Streptomyces sp. WAC05374]TDF49991.1 hypothetical protein E2B92_00025 [Streptomyces sp. WAC05374]TDF57717.1 hypothetical protein E2C02_07815 [Streptomyces sp. WAC05374]TDF60245.1 hypothetical protein E2C00_00050 [Streptomyces sp. WAC05374]